MFVLKIVHDCWSSQGADMEEARELRGRGWDLVIERFLDHWLLPQDSQNALFFIVNFFHFISPRFIGALLVVHDGGIR